MSIIKYHTKDDNQLVVRCAGSVPELKEMYEFLTDMRLCILNPLAYAMQYSIDSIIESATYKAITAKEGAFAKVVPFYRVSPTIIDEFLSENKSQAFFINNSRLDEHVTMVYLDNDIILGIMYSCRYKNNNFVGSSCYLHPAAKYDIMVPLLLIAGIRASVKAGEMGESVIFCPSYETGHRGFIKLFGEPNDEIRFQDYSIVFNDSSELEKITAKLDEYNDTHDQGTGNERLDEYLQSEESGWLPDFSIQRIQYTTDIRKMPDQLMRPYKKELFEWFDRFGISAEANWKKLVFKCGRDKTFAGSMNVYEYYTDKSREIYRRYRETGELPRPVEKKYSLDEIKLFVFEDESDILMDIIPEHLRKRLLESDCLVIGAMTPEKEIIGISVASRIKEGWNIGYQEYMHILEAYDSIGLQKKMMEAVLFVMVKSGCDALYIRNQMDNSKYNAEALIGGKASLAMRITNYIAMYRVNDFLNHEMFNKLVAQLSVDDAVTYITDATDGRVREFTKQCWNEGYYLNPDDYDRMYTPFIVENGRIVGSIFAVQVSDHELVIRDFYVGKNCNHRNPEVIMMLSILKKAAVEMSEDSVVVFKLRRRYELESIWKMLGDNGTSLEDTEYFYWLDNYDFSVDIVPDEMNMPEDLNIESGIAEKIRINNLIYEKNERYDLLATLMLEMTSRVPCKEICNYIKDYYMDR